MPDLSIIIVNYNTREPLHRCLESIRAQRGELDLQIIVVDNGSQDSSADLVRALAAGAAPLPLTLIEPGYNTWFTGGNNRGLQAAASEFVLFLNPDTQVRPGTLQTLLAYVQAHPNVGAATCQMRFPDGGMQRTCSRAPRFGDLLLGYTFLGALLAPWRSRRRAAMWYVGWDRWTTRVVEVIPDSCLIAPLTLIQRIGGFNEALKLYFTEDDLCKRIREAGREVHFVSDAVILHEEHASVGQVQRLASQVYFDDLIVYARKYCGLAAALLLRVLIVPTRWGMDLAQRLRGERKTL